MRLRFSWLSIWFGKQRSSLGARGEQLAARWLKQKGYRILKRNLAIGDDEADLVVLDPDRKTVVIVEVKTRGDDNIAPEASVSKRKQFHVARLAARLQKQKAYRDRPIRFDAIAIVWPENAEPTVRHIPGAFSSPW